MPSANVLEVKAARVAELEAKLKDAASFVIVDYKGITVADDTVLRRNLREANVEYFVEKNTLLKRALHNLGMESYDEVLNGTTAIAISQDDQTAPARILGEYAEKATGDFKLKAGCVEGEYFDEAKVMALSKIPSKDVLLAQLVGSLQGPIQKLAALLQAIVDKNGEAA
ncbi:MAG: 50S ribosomal protein L10 [Oscillospiraceae bacterium]|jgi:large subunit ribosomal protein L10|nr:50S ribosomal protein L10 [Oscillospiraceae bacterium]MBQ9696217.1 50S ribosomal protein L10 [Oscillospiraceae bacterium]MBR1897924.1 50S ribosomal protein L10 [Oscillospiraceae bacterium]